MAAATGAAWDNSSSRLANDQRVEALVLQQLSSSIIYTELTKGDMQRTVACVVN
jgi:hypothetical protein